MVKSAVLGFPRIGKNRELKKATEAYWSGKTSAEELLATAKQLRLEHWKLQKAQGVDIIPSNDFSLYDQIMDHSFSFNVIPPRYRLSGLSSLDTYFAMGRGMQRAATADKAAVDVPAGEMVKWFDSNYHFLRPEVSEETDFKLSSTKALDEFLEAKEAGIITRPVLVGPVTYLFIAKAAKGSSIKPIELLPKLLPVYVELIKKLTEAGAEYIQIDEPILTLDLPQEILASYKEAYETLGKIGKLILTTYFGSLQSNADVLKGLPIAGVHVDVVRAPENLDRALAVLGENQIISVGVVSGRNIWKTDFQKATAIIEKAISAVGSERVQVASSSSILHIPHSLSGEDQINPEIKRWFAFAVEKCAELAILTKAANDGPASVRAELEANAADCKARAESPITNVEAVRERQSKVTPQMHERKSPFETRYAKQQASLKLPLFPTTTIGSFPQTKEIRVTRNRFAKGLISQEEYDAFIRKEISDVVKFQEEVGLDVLVHGEPERNDMVQYFGERMEGFVFTVNGWVQSYGSRCVRPPIIVGDVYRPAPMTVKESQYAQSITSKPMKGMLTAPITILRWSFPRDDVHDSVQAQQIALGLRDEVLDLEKAGIKVIQCDEPALREGLPLRRAEWDEYLKWAIDAFRLATAAVQDDTQIHSHFCYSDFNDIFDAIQRLDADVVSIENSKSDMKLLNVLSRYTSCIGPGLFDIHSPRVPPVSEFKERIDAIVKHVPKDHLWLNPDCGLKTRGWPETTADLKNMIAAAREAREQYA
ncbi:homocysteine methyltransferase Met26 [Schizosaccharomyces pombe]|uniref:Probable 5-methyltetrahydropteroyltriglutamate--homocysteine methyltransferase n=1 Tax=Schizosaccharomyces pombe (strain 972 / ATCC 24843) TaxID=284812 RepID=METE_SCHPO|nr:homocysteine methyltransferase Met26 [Schizosaccharomyces pombe]Q9UT19.1 RecName: Full=Probable 5-methyltetrahydropteroyltriglutamate--homocysteine methyltransferase; AltName: Full=Cobalamin-independent methionine synthase; AltName: Full=Methionine synthase, vitamin-B12 independent isozyme [Schizosaccharomyces pombe 972h-]CAB57427.1 homocysteine methyltransferase Met26 [Schizosaccharomyces pombe]|eukprot:NP_593352.1 homocysteine methyltransferase Met26 [Schizosaccharomyces pombe]